MDRNKVALIHIVKRELKLSDRKYRNILQQAVGVKSAKDLNDEKFRKLMNYFVRSKHYWVNSLGLTVKQKLYIKYIAHQLGWSQDHLNNFIHKYYHKSHIDRLTRKEAIKAIESLKNIRQRG